MEFSQLSQVSFQGVDEYVCVRFHFSWNLSSNFFIFPPL